MRYLHYAILSRAAPSYAKPNARPMQREHTIQEAPRRPKLPGHVRKIAILASWKAFVGPLRAQAMLHAMLLNVAMLYHVVLRYVTLQRATHCYLMLLCAACTWLR